MESSQAVAEELSAQDLGDLAAVERSPNASCRVQRGADGENKSSDRWFYLLIVLHGLPPNGGFGSQALHTFVPLTYCLRHIGAIGGCGRALTVHHQAA